jgi:hypothetical protein
MDRNSINLLTVRKVYSGYVKMIVFLIIGQLFSQNLWKDLRKQQ